MPNAMSNYNSPGRVLLPPRISPPYASDPSSGSPGQTSPTEWRPPPLTPHNTFASRNGSVTVEDFFSSGSTSAQHDPDEHYMDLSELDHGALNDSESSQYDTQEDVEDVHCDTRSEPSPDTSGSTDKTVIHTRPIGSQRSKSVPARPLKSALASPTPPPKTPDLDHCGRKRARFDDNAITANLILRHATTEPTAIRRCSTPDRTDLMGRILQRDSFSEHAQSYYTDQSEGLEDEELLTAIGLFEEMVEELVQVAEEHAEAHDQLADIACEVAEAIFDRRANFDDGNGKDDSGTSDGEDKVPPHESGKESELVVALGRSSADEDVDESCMENPAMDLSCTEDELCEDDLEDHNRILHQQADAQSLSGWRGPREPTLESIVEEPNSSTETICDASSMVSGITPQRRFSNPQSSTLGLASSETIRRRASMTDFTKLKGKLKLLPRSPKGSPAGCAVTVCSVRAAESPKLRTVHEHPGTRYRLLEGDGNVAKMAQSVRSDAGTFQVVWIEPPASSYSNNITLLDSSDQAPELVISEGDDEILRTPSPMDKVKVKLAAWSWAREQGLDAEHGGPNWIPLLSCADEVGHSLSGTHSPRTDEPYAPPNTERQSGASSAKHSAPHSPLPERYNTPDAEDEEDDHPLELKAKAILARPSSATPTAPPKPQNDYLTLPIQQTRSAPSSDAHLKAVTRELSNLNFEDAHFKTHKDSLVLLHGRKDEGKMNQQLMNAHDSVILARSKFDHRYPTSFLDSRPAWSRAGAVSPILDASPPDARLQASLRAMERAMETPERRERETQEQYTDRSHPDEHVDCPICEVERPRWFEANCKKGPFV